MIYIYNPENDIHTQMIPWGYGCKLIMINAVIPVGMKESLFYSHCDISCSRTCSQCRHRTFNIINGWQFVTARGRLQIYIRCTREPWLFALKQDTLCLKCAGSVWYRPWDTEGISNGCKKRRRYVWGIKVRWWCWNSIKIYCIVLLALCPQQCEILHQKNHGVHCDFIPTPWVLNMIFIWPKQLEYIMMKVQFELDCNASLSVSVTVSVIMYLPRISTLDSYSVLRVSTHPHPHPHTHRDIRHTASTFLSKQCPSLYEVWERGLV